MPNNAEMIEKLAILATCRKILNSIDEGDCKTVEDIKVYLKQLIEATENKWR